jgi:hypothetical protein
VDCTVAFKNSDVEQSLRCETGRCQQRSRPERGDQEP